MDKRYLNIIVLYCIVLYCIVLYWGHGLRSLVTLDVMSYSPFVSQANKREFGRRIKQFIRSRLGLFSTHPFNDLFHHTVAQIVGYKTQLLLKGATSRFWAVLLNRGKP